MASKNDNNPKSEPTFFDYIATLRPHIVRVAIAFLMFAVGAFMLKGFLVDSILFGPQSPDFLTNKAINHIGILLGSEGRIIEHSGFNIINTAVAGQFNLHLKITLVTAFVAVVPYLLWEIWRFIRPALRENERKASRLFVFYLSICFFSGFLFGYFIIAPLALNFLLNYSVSVDINNMIDISSYLSTVIGSSVACAVVFQLPILIWLLARMGLITATFMRAHRHHAIFIIALFSAIITPPDAMSMILVFIPFYTLYEYGIHIASKASKKGQTQTTNTHN